MKKLLVSAYACEPGLGSEIGVGWHWMIEMSRHFRLWVLTRESNRERIERWMAENPGFENITFVYFDLPRWARFWKKGLRGVRTYYNLWQFFSNSLVRKTMKANDIHAFHHLTYGNAMWPVSRYGSRAETFIWGPVGGLETISPEYYRHYDLRQRMAERIRHLAAWITRHSLGFNRRCKRASLILCKTQITRSAIPQQYQHKTVMFTDVAADPASASESIEVANTNKHLSLICVGRLEAWRGFDLALEAVARVCKDAGTPDVKLTIIGKGPDRERLETMAQELRLKDCVEFAGKVSQERYSELMGGADVVLNPSLKEGAVTVAFDAMAMGKPLIAIDTTGYTRYFDESCSVIVPMGSRDAVIAAIAEAIERMRDLELRIEMGRNARRVAKGCSWAVHGEEIADIISDCLENGC